MAGLCAQHEVVISLDWEPLRRYIYCGASLGSRMWPCYGIFIIRNSIASTSCLVY